MVVLLSESFRMAHSNALLRLDGRSKFAQLPSILTSDFQYQQIPCDLFFELSALNVLAAPCFLSYVGQ